MDNDIKYQKQINSLPHNKNVDVSKLKPFASNNFSMAQMMNFFSFLQTKRQSFGVVKIASKINVMQILKFVIGRLENIAGKEKKPFKNIVGNGVNAGFQYFLLFPQCF